MHKKLIFVTFYFLISDVVSRRKIKEQENVMTCAERNTYSDVFEYQYNSWNMGNPIKSSFLSFLEALAGDYINFFILNRYGMSEPIENTAETLYNKGQTFYPYTSICELARYSYIPYEKMVINECVGESCGNTFDVASKEVLSGMISEASNGNYLGGISIGNYNANSSSDDLLFYDNVILENNNKSAFFEKENTGMHRKSMDVPRFVLNVEEFPGAYGTGLEEFFTKVQKHGVNYVVVDDYNADTSSIGDNLKWYKNNCVVGEENSCLSGGYTKVLANVTNISDVISKIIYKGEDAYYQANKIAQIIRDYKLDGVVLNFNSIQDFLSNPDSLCAAAFLIQKISENVKPNIIAIRTDIKYMLPFVENVLWSAEKKTEVWNFMRDSVDGYNRCYKEKVNPQGKEWENKVVQNDVFFGNDYSKPANDEYIAKNFFEVFRAFGANRSVETI